MATEKRLIDANAFEEKMKKFIGGTSIGFVLVGALRNEPTVDAVEVVHGRWEEHPDEYGICATEFTCSACKESYCTSELLDEQFIEMMKYCPNCGAKMDGDGNG